MTEKGDWLSRHLLRCVDILLMKNPERTVLGVLLGITLSFLSKLFEPSLVKIDSISLAKVHVWEFISLGILAIHFPYVISKIIRKPRINDDVDEVISLIEKSNFSEKEKRQMYRNLVNKCISSLSLEQKNRLIFDSASDLSMDD
jgi:hypothetical protein